jgi:hypothetical protein
MSTNLEIITDALRGLNVIDETETPSAEQGSFCLRQLNQMLAAWKDADGIDLGYFKQSSTTDTCPIPEWAETGVWGRLALRVSSHFGAQVPVGTAAAASEGYETILRVLTNQKLEGSDMSHLPIGTGYYGSDFDIESGDF